MPKVGSYTVIQDTIKSLPDNGDIDFTFATFSAPNLTASPGNPDRPVLSYKVKPNSDDARIEIDLNGTIVESGTFADGPVRTVTEVLANGVLLAAGNTLTVTNRGAGGLDISDLMIHYKANV
jgi:hypothetical protein